MERVIAVRPKRTMLYVFLASLTVAFISLAGFWLWAVKDLPRVPDQATLWVMNREPGVTFVDETGATIGIRGRFYGKAVKLTDLPDHVVNAFLAIEDKRFFEHRGVDRQGIVRAFLVNLRAGATVQGGSTITQQLVKNLFLTPERTMQRKLQEMILAGRIENRLTKEEILELYLNRVYLGDQAFGVDAAARRFFGKTAAELSLAEAAMIAGLPKAPSRSAPTENLARARERQQLVLHEMVQARFITEEERAAAAVAPLVVASQTPPEGELGYVFDAAVDEARRRTGATSPDLVITVTIDPALQDAARESVIKALGAAGRNKTRPLQGALVTMDRAGAIRAMVGGTSYTKNKFNRATQARRQPGSAFKIFVYAAAVERGLDPDTVRYDEPVTIQGWRPENYDESYRGAVTLRTAFKDSLNTVAAEVADEVGLTEVADLACRFGVTSIPCTDEARSRKPIPPSIALGSMEVTLLEMTQATSVFMRDGQRIDGFLVSRVENSRGDVLFQRPPLPQLQVYDPENVKHMNNMMGRVVQNGTGTSARLSGRDVAGKTGTSQNWRDAWFVGFTHDYATGVWVGFDDSTEMPRITGGSLPSMIFSDFMSIAERGKPAVKIPGMNAPERSPRQREASSFFDRVAEALGKPPERDEDRPGSDSEFNQ
jgi:penicillin-binding protein 1A